MKAYDVIGYAADASIWCIHCFNRAGYDPNGEDHEGNPVHPVFAGDEGADEEHCTECGDSLMG